MYHNPATLMDIGNQACVKQLSTLDRFIVSIVRDHGCHLECVKQLSTLNRFIVSIVRDHGCHLECVRGHDNLQLILTLTHCLLLNAGATTMLLLQHSVAYKKPCSKLEAREFLREWGGPHFDLC